MISENELLGCILDARCVEYNFTPQVYRSHK